MRNSGFEVDVKVVPDVTAIRRGLGLQDLFASGHTAWLQATSDIVEGHAPADDVRKLLKEKPKARTVAVPGMPPSAPGMDLPVDAPYEALLVQRDDANQVFAGH